MTSSISSILAIQWSQSSYVFVILSFCHYRRHQRIVICHRCRPLGNLSRHHYVIRHLQHQCIVIVILIAPAWAHNHRFAIDMHVESNLNRLLSWNLKECRLPIPYKILWHIVAYIKKSIGIPTNMYIWRPGIVAVPAGSGYNAPTLSLLP